MTVLKSVWILCLIFTLTACSQMKIRKGFQDHTWYSSAKPFIGIKINPDFNYVKYKTSTRTGSDVDNNSIFDKTLVRQTLFAFENKLEKKTIVIALKFLGKPGWAFKPGLFPIKNAFNTGRTDILGNSYQFCTYVVNDLSGDYLVKGYGRMVGALSDTLLLIHYVEKQDDSWEKPMLTDRQKETLSLFESNCDKDLQILEEVTIPEADAFQAPAVLSQQEDAALSAFMETLVFPRAIYLTWK